MTNYAELDPDPHDYLLDPGPAYSGSPTLLRIVSEIHCNCWLFLTWQYVYTVSK